MAKKTKIKEDPFVAEMRTWLQQQDNRLANCKHQIESHEDVIKHSKQKIDDSRKAIRLEREQIRWFRKRRIAAQKELDTYLREQQKSK